MDKKIILIGFAISSIIVVIGLTIYFLFIKKNCQPKCSGKQCGDNGCNGTCGTCSDSKQCIQGKCIEKGVQCGKLFCNTNQKCIEGVCESSSCKRDCANKNCGDDNCGGQCGSCNSNELCEDGNCKCIPDCKNNTCGLDPVCGIKDCGSCNLPNKYCEDGQCKTGCESCLPNQRCNLKNICVNNINTTFYIQSKNGVDTNGNPLFIQTLKNNNTLIYTGYLVNNKSDASPFKVQSIDENGAEKLDHGFFIPDYGDSKTLHIETTIENGSLNHYAMYWDAIQKSYTYVNITDGPGSICTIYDVNNTCPTQKASTTKEKAAIVKVFS